MSDSRHGLTQNGHPAFVGWTVSCGDGYIVTKFGVFSGGLHDRIQMATKTSKVASKKAAAKKVVHSKVYGDGKTWTVHHGELKAPPKLGRPPATTEHLFRVVAEKLPYASLTKVKAHLGASGYAPQGVYIAHDSMGCPRYIGRGNIFARLEARFKAQPLQLAYFSFYVVADKKHEREIETLMIRAAGFLLEYNTKKKRVSVLPGNVHDYEAGTVFYERQRKKGATKAATK